MKSSLKPTLSASFFALAVFNVLDENLSLFMLFLGLSISVWFVTKEDLSQKINSPKDLMSKEFFQDPVIALVSIAGNLLIIFGTILFVYSEVTGS